MDSADARSTRGEEPFNVGKFLSAELSGVIGDDGSNEDTVEAIQELLSRLRLFAQEEELRSTAVRKQCRVLDTKHEETMKEVMPSLASLRKENDQLLHRVEQHQQVWGIRLDQPL